MSTICPTMTSSPPIAPPSASGRRRGRPRQRRLSTLLRGLGATKAERLKVSEIIAFFGDRAIGAALFAFAAPNLIPLPPGASALFGAPLIFIAAQLAMGRRVLWLPRALGDRSIAMADYRRLLKRGMPALRRIERLLAPRLEFLFGRVGDRLVGLVCLLLAVILFIPVPLLNWMPAFAITAFSLGIMNRDGVAGLIGGLATIFSGVLVVFVSGAAWAAAVAFVNGLSAALAQIAG